ncbi:MAG: DctP family TRAP transporter solute-binding subunit [Butyricicoccus sp.]
MKRCKAIIALGLSVTLITAALAGCGSSNNRSTDDGDSIYPKLNLSMAVNGTDTQIDTKVGQYLSELVAERSDGCITIDVFPNDTLAGGNATKGIEYVCAGSTDLAAYATSTLAAIEPKINVATMPWTFTSYAEAAEVIDTQGCYYYAELLEAKGLTYLGSFHNGFRQLTNSKHAVTTPEDLKGLKIRIPGSKIYMTFWNAVGASPTAMSWSEVFTAIQQGTIDGQENGAPITQSAKMQEVQDYMTIWNYCYDSDLIIANAAVWDNLDENTQALLEECIAEACAWGREKIETEEEEIIQSFIDGGMQVDRLTEEQLEPFQALIREPMKTIKADYGRKACEAFNIEWDVDE